MDHRALINKRFLTVKGDIFIVEMQATSLLTCSYFQPINKQYLSTRQIFFFEQLTAFSAAHFDANTAILRQMVRNLLHGKLCAIFFWNTLYIYTLRSH